MRGVQPEDFAEHLKVIAVWGHNDEGAAGLERVKTHPQKANGIFVLKVFDHVMAEDAMVLLVSVGKKLQNIFLNDGRKALRTANGYGLCGNVDTDAFDSVIA